MALDCFSSGERELEVLGRGSGAYRDGGDETGDTFMRMGIACVCDEGGFSLQQVALRQAVICSQTGEDLRRTVTPTAEARCRDEIKV